MSEQLIPTPSEFAKYTLEKELGHGGMGGVYLGHDNMLDRKVAIKVMLKSYGEDPTFVERFKKEAQAAAKLSHPNIAQIYEFDLFEGQPYIAMELVSGGSLDKSMEKNPGQLDPAFVMQVGLQIADGLGAAAERGLVHGDVKPENILFSTDGTAKLVDFGLAAMQGDTGEIWGTPYYISPEKVRRQKIDFRADIYSLGGTLYHALTGVAPYEGNDAAEVVKARFDGPPRKPSEVREGIPPKIDEIIMRMLEAEPSKRYPTYESLKGDISRFLEKSGVKKGGNIQSSTRKIVIKGRGGHAMIAPTGSLSPTDSYAGLPRPPIPTPPPPPPKNVGAMVGAVVGGVILLILVVALLLVWFVHNAHVKEQERIEREVTKVQTDARASINKTLQKAHDFMSDLDEFCGDAVKTVENTTMQVYSMLSDRGVTREMLVPGPSKELLDAMAAASAPAPEAAPAADSAAPAAQAPAAQAPAAQAPQQKGVRVHAEYDPNSPEAQDAAKAEAEKKAKEPAPAAAAPAEQAPAATSEEDLPPIAKTAIQRVRELWVDAYACSAAVVTVRAKLADIDAFKAKADLLTAQDEPTSQALAKISRDVDAELSNLKNQPIVGNAQRKKGVIKTKSQNIIEQTRKEINTVLKKKDEEARRQKEEEERKEREARAAEEHKALVEKEIGIVDSKYAAYKSSLLRSLSCQPAITQLEGLRNGVGGVTTKEAKERIDCYVNGLKYMKGLLEYLDRSVKNFQLANGTVLNAARGGKVDILPKGAKKKTTLDWYAYFNKDAKGFNTIIKELVERREKQRLSLMDWSHHMMGAALVLKTLYGDNDGAVKRADSLVVAAVRDYPDCKKKAQGVFPEINIDDAVKAAESSDGDL